MLMLSGDSTEGERVIPQSVGSEASAASDGALRLPQAGPRRTPCALGRAGEKCTRAEDRPAQEEHVRPRGRESSHHAHTHAIGTEAKSGIRRNFGAQVHSRPSAQPLAGSHGSPRPGAGEGSGVGTDGGGDGGDGGDGGGDDGGDGGGGDDGGGGGDDGGGGGEGGGAHSELQTSSSSSAQSEPHSSSSSSAQSEPHSSSSSSAQSEPHSSSSSSAQSEPHSSSSSSAQSEPHSSLSSRQRLPHSSSSSSVLQSDPHDSGAVGSGVGGGFGGGDGGGDGGQSEARPHPVDGDEGSEGSAVSSSLREARARELASGGGAHALHARKRRELGKAWLGDAGECRQGDGGLGSGGKGSGGE